MKVQFHSEQSWLKKTDDFPEEEKKIEKNEQTKKSLIGLRITDLPTETFFQLFVFLRPGCLVTFVYISTK